MTNLSDPTRTVNTTAADHRAADRLAWLADAPDNDSAAYPGPGWDDEDDRDPADIDDDGGESELEIDARSIEADAHETGYAIGLLGESPSYDTVNPHHSWLTKLAGLTPYQVGHAKGLAEHARRVGYAAGLDGLPPTLPTGVHYRQALPFVQGHAAGRVERAERETEMAAYFARLDFEAELEARDREHEALAREAGGLYRLHPSMVD